MTDLDKLLSKMQNSINLSDEQEELINKVLEGKNVLVNACIGSGKTTTIQALCDRLSEDTKILYLTYNKLLKVDAKAKILNRNVMVQNYHGFAYICLKKSDISCGQGDLIKTFINSKVRIPHYDMLIIDEYQDIDAEISELLWLIKERNPNIQIVIVGDMDQKIYDWTSLDVKKFVEDFIGEHEEVTFTNCFRLSKEYAEKIGFAWNKEINGVNPNTEIKILTDYREAVKIMKDLDVGDILCLGQRTGDMARSLNLLEKLYPDKFNKSTVYASISDTGDTGSVTPKSDNAIFTTFDGSKGMERNNCFIFDFTPSYWASRAGKPNAKISILRNIFLVAASRGKKHIYFIRGLNENILDNEFLGALTDDENVNFYEKPFSASDMFKFKYKEDLEDLYNMLETKKIPMEDTEVIQTKGNDELIDLSPVYGIYQQACFFTGYNVQGAIDYENLIHYDKKVRTSAYDTDEKKILKLVASQTTQERYETQVKIPFISASTTEKIKKRLGSVFSPNEKVEVTDGMKVIVKKDREINIVGRCDVLRDDCVYELKFTNELSHEHFLQCAMYIFIFELEKGYLWNVKANEMYEVRIKDKEAYLKQVVKTITKGAVKKFEDYQFWL